MNIIGTTPCGKPVTERRRYLNGGKGFFMVYCVNRKAFHNLTDLAESLGLVLWQIDWEFAK